MFAPTLFTLVYVVSADGDCVLLMRRDNWPADVHFGKYVGLGGRWSVMKM
jgi:8-oxo-dGTP diphosphatase